MFALVGSFEPVRRSPWEKTPSRGRSGPARAAAEKANPADRRAQGSTRWSGDPRLSHLRSTRTRTRRSAPPAHAATSRGVATAPAPRSARLLISESQPWRCRLADAVRARPLGRLPSWAAPQASGATTRRTCGSSTAAGPRRPSPYRSDPDGERAGSAAVPATSSDCATAARRSRFAATSARIGAYGAAAPACPSGVAVDRAVTVDRSRPRRYRDTQAERSILMGRATPSPVS
jgi:hypothetical protein